MASSDNNKRIDSPNSGAECHIVRFYINSFVCVEWHYVERGHGMMCIFHFGYIKSTYVGLEGELR